MVSRVSGAVVAASAMVRSALAPRMSFPMRLLLAALSLVALLATSCGDDGGGGGGGGGNVRAVSFHADVAPILQQRCVGCHTAGKIGEFSLHTFADAGPLAQQIAAQTQAGLMPPWGAHDTDECQPSRPWKNDARLTDAEKATLQAWADQGAPEGDPASAPGQVDPPNQGLAAVDLELVPETSALIEGERDQFTCVIYDPALTEEKWIDGIHFVPGNTEVAHHALTFRVDRERALELSGGDERYPCFGGSPGEIVHVWAPGAQAFQLPEKVGIKLTPDQVLVVQMHYHPVGTPREDRSAVQLHFAPEEPEHELYVLFPGNAEDSDAGLLPGPNDRGAPEFRIPAGATGHVESMSITVPNEVFLELPILMVMSHMHYVGVDLKMEIERPDPGGGSETECLLQTPAWNFNWQRFYEFDVPIEELPTARAGDIVHIRCRYENTKDNPFVRQALLDGGLAEPVEVLLGEETLDEMCLAPVGVLIPAGILD